MTATQSPNLPNQTLPKSSCLIQKCEDLPLEIFIQIREDGNHKRLGEGDTATAWSAIKIQYDELTGGDGYTHLTLLMREINYLTTKLRLIGLITEMMAKYYLPQFGEVLSNYGFKYEWEDIDDETREKQLSYIRSSSKTWYVQLKAKEREWDKLTADVDTGKTKNHNEREYFEDWLIGFSKDQGYHMTTHTTTTYQFALMLGKAIKNRNKKAKK